VEGTVPAAPPSPGDLIEYDGEPVFDLLIVRGDRGTVVSVADGWVRADWKTGTLSVPTKSVRVVG
jgi:hypothetical protein